MKLGVVEADGSTRWCRRAVASAPSSCAPGVSLWVLLVAVASAVFLCGYSMP